MNNSPLLHACLIALVALLNGCSSDSPSSNGGSGGQSATQVDAPVAAEKPSGGVKVSAFLRGAGADEASTKAFEQGMQLAADAKSPQTPEIAVVERSQGAPESETLRSIAKSAETPILVYWQTRDLNPAAASLGDSKGIMVPVWNVTQDVARLGSNVFGFGYSTERTFAEFAKFAGKKLKSYRFGVISSSAAPFEAQSDAFIEETKSQGNTVVFDEKAESASSDFTGLISRASKENCDTIFAVLPSNTLVALIKAARVAGYKGKILVGDSFSSAELSALGKDAEGIHLVQAWSDDPTFQQHYTAKFGGQPDGITLGAAALGYDLIKCIEAAGPSPDSEAIKYAWLSQACEGLTGKTQFSGERIAQRQKRILTVKNGRFEAVG